MTLEELTRSVKSLVDMYCRTFHTEFRFESTSLQRGQLFESSALIGYITCHVVIDDTILIMGDWMIHFAVFCCVHRSRDSLLVGQTNHTNYPSGGDLHPPPSNTWFLGSTRTTSWLVQPFLQGSWTWPTDRQTCRPRYNWNESYLSVLPSCIVASTHSHPAEGRRLSWPEWLIA